MDLSNKLMTTGKLMLIGPITKVDIFSYSDAPNFSLAVRYNYSVDLDNDGLDELIFAGFETQRNTPAEYDNTKVTIFGWSNGKFQNLTTKWLPGNLSQVEAVGDVAVGDFNGDGLVDLYLSAYADMDYQVNAYQLLNKGGSFEKVTLGLSQWEHGAISGDLNNDGYDDVVVFGYLYPVPFLLGGPNGLTKSYASNNWVNNTHGYATNGSGGAIGDFYADGTISVVIVDNATIKPDDTVISRVYINSNGVVEGFSSPDRLPAPFFGESSHDVRARPFDFNGDGKLDILIFSRPSWDGSEWPLESRIQFLENKGDGSFEDVTSSRLVGYNTNSSVSYTPVIRDFNHDGLIDIFVSEPSFNVDNISTAFLIQNQDGTFVDTARQALSFGLEDNGGMAGVVRGPNGVFYIVYENQAFGGDSTVSIAPITFPERDQSEFLNGTNQKDVILGLGGDDVIQGLAGDDMIDGGDGLDIAIYTGSSDDYQIQMEEDSIVVKDLRVHGDGTDFIRGMERLQFSDINVALDIAGTAGQAYRIYEAVLGRAPDLEGLGYWINDMDNGVSLTTIAKGFVSSPEFQSKYGANPSYETYLNLLYNNILDRDPDTDGMNYWVSNMRNGIDTPAIVLASFSEGYENTANVAPDIANGIYYKPWLT
jgi:Domain of unknown function (DUF4214)/FG-GAP-like repeat/RTX calcium-binding nonapeptide repeat (4 copies)